MLISLWTPRANLDINYIKLSLKIRNENLWKIKLINIVLSTLTGIIITNTHWIIVIYLYEKLTE